MKIITLGNATYDIFLAYPSSQQASHAFSDSAAIVRPEDEPLEVEHFHASMGGGALQSACALKMLGCESIPFCVVGSDPLGAYIKEQLVAKQISLVGVRTTERCSTSVSCIISYPESESVLLVYRGASSFSVDQNILEQQMCDARGLYIAPLQADGARVVEQLLVSSRYGCEFVMLNPSVYQLTTGIDDLCTLLPHIDVLMLNAREARLLYMHLAVQNSSVGSLPTLHTEFVLPPLAISFISGRAEPYTLAHFIQRILPYHIPYVIITDGAAGVYVITQEIVLYHPAFTVHSTNNRGVGDAFGATFLYALLHHATLAEALAYGMLHAKSVLSSVDATSGLLSKQALRQQFQQHKTTLVQEIRIKN